MLRYVFLFGLIVPQAARAELIKIGTKIHKAEADMRASGYSTGSTGKVPIDLIRDLIGLPEKNKDELESGKTWLVAEGYLSISYIVSTGTITSLRYYLIENRQSMDAVEFKLEVSSFEPSTGQMIVETKAPKLENNKGAAPPTTKPADKAPEEDQPSTPTSKNGPRHQR